MAAGFGIVAQHLDLIFFDVSHVSVSQGNWKEGHDVLRSYSFYGCATVITLLTAASFPMF
jgi:hypothetical protein